MPIERELLVLIGERAAAKADLHHMVVEVGNLRPTLAHFGSKQLWVAAAGEYRIGVVIDHHAVFAPQQNDGNGRAQQDLGDGFQALRPCLKRAEAGFDPIELSYQGGEFTSGGRE